MQAIQFALLILAISFAVVAGQPVLMRYDEYNRVIKWQNWLRLRTGNHQLALSSVPVSTLYSGHKLACKIVIGCEVQMPANVEGVTEGSELDLSLPNAYSEIKKKTRRISWNSVEGKKNVMVYRVKTWIGKDGFDMNLFLIKAQNFDYAYVITEFEVKTINIMYYRIFGGISIGTV